MFFKKFYPLCTGYAAFLDVVLFQRVRIIFIYDDFGAWIFFPSYTMIAALLTNVFILLWKYFRFLCDFLLSVSVSHKMNAMMYKIEIILALWHYCFIKTIFTSQGGNLQSSSPYGSPARSPSPYRGTGIHSLISSASVPRKLLWFFLFLSFSFFL